MEFLRAGKPLEAAPLLKEIATAEPTADTYNDLSYAYLLGKEYKLAAEAGKQALKLNNQHAGTLYNVGMAMLELGEPSQAEGYLSHSSTLQPDRYEPYVGLVRANQALQNGPLASHYLREAERLGAVAQELAQHRSAVAALFDFDVKDVPADLAPSCAQLREAALCLWQDGKGGPYDLYYLPTEKGAKAQRIRLGPIFQAEGIIDRAQLPGGVQGYWVRQPDIVADMYAWRLFALKEGRLQPVIAATGTYPATELFRGFGEPPAIRGDTIGSSGFNASRNGLLHWQWKLSADLTTATLISQTKGDFK